MDSLSKFFGTKTRIIHDGKKIQQRKEVFSLRPQFNPFHR